MICDFRAECFFDFDCPLHSPTPPPSHVTHAPTFPALPHSPRPHTPTFPHFPRFSRSHAPAFPIFPRSHAPALPRFPRSNFSHTLTFHASPTFHLLAYSLRSPGYSRLAPSPSRRCSPHSLLPQIIPHIKGLLLRSPTADPRWRRLESIQSLPFISTLAPIR